MTSTVRRPRSRRAGGWLDSWRFPVLLFVCVLAVLAVVVQTSHDHLKPEHPATGPDISDAPYYGGWMQFDTGWYVYLAEHGYDAHQITEFKEGRQSAVAYFPAYPLAVREIAHATGDDYVRAAELTTVAFGLVVLLLFWTWCGRRMPPGTRRTAVLLFALYPYAWFLYGSGYGDVLFIAATLTAFLLLERDRPVLAGLAGAVASAARLIGFGTAIGLVALLLERRHAVVRAPAEGRRRLWRGWRFDRSRLRIRDAGVLLSFGGIASYSVFLWHRAGDFIAFNTVQAAPGWNQGTGIKTWIKYEFVAIVVRGSHGYAVRIIIEALLCLLFIALLPFVYRRFGAGYTIYTAVILSIPAIGSSTFQGFGRYLLGAFPVFAVGAELLEDRDRARRTVLVVSAVGIVVGASFFGRGYYLS
ncbi:MAG TPA: hypothetical protein VGZ52_03935 [Acidimicrobiales bacterium]|nr:hypothetical protein [Acidimicrobiales bacterium]